MIHHLQFCWQAKVDVMRLIVAIALVGLLFGVCGAWDNAVQNDLYVVCPAGEAISSIQSQYVSDKYDRQFSIQCRPYVYRFDSCSWSPLINNLREVFLYSCPEKSVITGMHSFHDMKKRDRIWRFFCCQNSKYRVVNTYTAYPHMQVEGSTSNSVDSDHWYRGVFSYYDLNHYDRGWQYELATLLEA